MKPTSSWSVGVGERSQGWVRTRTGLWRGVAKSCALALALTSALVAGPASAGPGPSVSPSAPTQSGVGIRASEQTLTGPPGSVIPSSLTMVNTGQVTQAVVFKQVSLELGDNGQVLCGSQPDPRFAGVLGLPTKPFKAKGGNSQELPVMVTVPALGGGEYLVGFSATSSLGAGQTVEVCTYFHLAVPGSRAAQISVKLDGPSWALSQTELSLTVTNTGEATTSAVIDGLDQLVVAGKMRSSKVSVDGWGRRQVQVDVPWSDGVGVRHATATKEVWVLPSLWVLIVIAALIVFAGFGGYKWGPGVWSATRATGRDIKERQRK